MIVEDLLYGDNEQSNHSKNLAAAGDEEQYDVWLLLGLIGRVHNICIYINRSPEHREVFEALLQGMLGVKNWLVLLVNGGIRWHSTYDMIQRVLKLKEFIIRWQRLYVYTKGVDIRVSFLSSEDFEILEIWAYILKDFKQLCLEEEETPDETTQGIVAGVLMGLTYIYDRIDRTEREIKSLRLAPHSAKPSEVKVIKKIEHAIPESSD